MKRARREAKPSVKSSNLFGRLLTFWSEYRRFLLLGLISLVLASFLSSLSPDARRNLSASLLAQRSLVILLLTFSLLTLSLLLSSGQRLDLWVFLLFNLRGHHPLWLDRIMWALTQFGNGAAGILLGILLYFGGERRLAVELLLGILSLWLVVELLKAIVERTRPFLALEDVRVVGMRERGQSFPSGHTSQAFFMATFLSRAFEIDPLITGLLYATAVMVGFTRIYVGAHYPRDVIAGAILGNVWGILTEVIEVYRSGGPI
jgi:membrane-associated phospholipid phosphatase